MARVELPESRLRLRKRRRRVRLALLLCALLAVLVAAVAGLSRLPALQVSEITISGAETISPGAIKALVEDHIAGYYLYALPKRNILLYPKKDIAAALLKTYPSLASADVHAGDFHTIVVNVVERAPRALWCQEARCYLMDENGVVYAEAPTFSSPVYLTYYGEASAGALPRQYLVATEFQALSALVDAVARLVPDATAVDVTVDSNRDAHVRFSSGFELRFVLDDQVGDVFERFTLALTAEPLLQHELSEFEYLDLRFGDKLYYKLRE